MADKGTKFTSYLWEPQGKVAGNGKILSKEWKWDRLQFELRRQPCGTALHCSSTAPTSGVEELLLA